MKQDSAVFAVCLILALGLLLLEKLSRIYIHDIHAKVAYVNPPEGKIPNVPLPETIRVFVKTTGFKLVWAKWRKPVGIVVDMSGVSEDNTLQPADLRSGVAKQFPSDFEVIQTVPDKLVFGFDRSLRKKVPVSPDIQIEFKKQYDFMEPMLIKPDSIEIYGPENIVSEIKKWKTQNLQFSQLDKTVKGELALAEPDIKSVSISKSKIEYLISVEEYTEKTLEAEIEKVNAKAGKDVQIYPKNARLVFRVGLSNYELADEKMFRVTADFSGVDMRKGKYVPVTVEKSPAFIKNLDYSPKSVEFIVFN